MRFNLFVLPLLFVALLSVACGPSDSESATPISRDQLYRATLSDIRLGDGVPLSLDVAIRWQMTDTAQFFQQFDEPSTFNSQVLVPRSMEVASLVSNQYPSVDSIFGQQRYPYMEDLKQNFLTHLGEEGIYIKEIILAEISFPAAYTQAKEKVGLKEQELEAIRQQSVVELAQAQANKEQTEANGQVAIAKAQADGRLEKIQAQIEESRRRRQLGQAETEKQVAEKRAESEVRRKELLAKADLQQEKDRKQLAVQHQREMEMLEVEKKKAMDQVAWEQELELARLCSENPTYASFLVNRELASKVEIAVLPAGGEANVFADLLRQPKANTPQP
ncbi:MAG: SPFH domain-containing protein [Bacteroidota bacterium]